MFELMFFGMYAAVLVGAAIGVIASRNPVHSAMFLVLAFVTSAILWVLMEAEFLGITLVLVYVGAVMVLFLFVVMMLDINASTLRGGFWAYAPVGVIVALVVIAQIWSVVWLRNQEGWGLVQKAPAPQDYSNTRELGAVIYTEYVYPFELAAFILLLAIVAAIVLTMRRRPGLKIQDISDQVSVERRDRVRMVQMDAERD